GASAYPRVMEYAPFREIADEIGATLLVDFAHVAGLVATGHHPSPVPIADFVTSTTHKTLRGPRGGFVLCASKWAQALDKSVFPGIQGGPLMHAIAAKAVGFHEALQPDFSAYQRQVIENARAMADEFTRSGLRLVAGGTDTHLILVDVSVKGLTGKAVEAYLDEIGITVNKNAIPFDKQKPFVASGIRLGTPAITSRGFGVEECRQVARIICAGFDDIERRTQIDRLRDRVRELTSRFDVP
ncbi:MAG: serine hydroxymethyltransferase, partial [Candidatus Eremiobacteraeota bacterium]|nr:serine hydroxymethyltransferase [Candidatus Eremiobacteraeota bacterium]